MTLLHGDEFDEKLVALRGMYEPYVTVLSNYLALRLPPWIKATAHPDNWQTSAWGRVESPLRSDPTVSMSDTH